MLVDEAERREKLPDLTRGKGMTKGMGDLDEAADDGADDKDGGLEINMYPDSESGAERKPSNSFSIKVERINAMEEGMTKAERIRFFRWSFACNLCIGVFTCEDGLRYQPTDLR